MKEIFTDASLPDAGWYVVKAQYDRHVRRYSQLRNEEAKVQYKKDAEADVELRLKVSTTFSHLQNLSVTFACVSLATNLKNGTER